MTIDELQALLSNLDGATFAALDTVTKPVLKGGKSNPMQGKIEKRCIGHRVMLFSNKKSSGYENKVRRHLEREGKNPDSFELGPLPWGERLPESPIIHNKGKFYLQVVFLASGSVEYRATQNIVRYSPDFMVEYEAGDIIPKDEIDGLNERSGSEHQGLDNEVIVRTYSLDSIVKLRAFHEELA